MLAAKIIRKALQSQHGTLVQLMYKLDPEDYKTEASVDNLVKLLEESPLNRQPLPDAGNKIGGYYRRLQRKPHEASFLVREDKVHDDMPRALQRLLRERELTFEGYETTIEELKEFCGMAPEASLYLAPQRARTRRKTGRKKTKRRTKSLRQPAGPAFPSQVPTPLPKSNSVQVHAPNLLNSVQASETPPSAATESHAHPSPLWLRGLQNDLQRLVLQ